MSRDITHPANREALLYLLTLHAMYERGNRQSDVEFVEEEDMTMGGLRTHPDLGGLLSSASREIPGVIHGYILGYDVLMNARGILFAFATGMNILSFRLYPSAQALQTALEKGPKIQDLSSEWWGVGVFNGDFNTNDVVGMCLRALENIDKVYPV